jgi:ABC-type transport system involved in cytochrome c biogenesis permease subunit
MPCPLVSLSIAAYSGYERKNILLLALLTVWGLTGIKSLLFNAYEDLILLVCGIYGVYLIAAEYIKRKTHKASSESIE